MKWMKFTIDTTTEAVDFIGSMLSDLGIEGIEIEDNVPLTEEEKNQMFIDILPEVKPNDKSAKVSFYVDPSCDLDSLIMKVKEGLREISDFGLNLGSGQLTASETEDKDWIDNWKKFFKPFRIDDTIVIKPTWEKLTDVKPDDLVIEIDPGISFGTGSHETTKLSILGIKKYIKPGDIVLDAGSGSGILSIVSNKLGASKVLGIDIDPIATQTAIENARINQIDALEWELDNENYIPDRSVSFATGNIIEDHGIRTRIGKGTYDLVVANILADVIISLSHVIHENMKKDAIFISSGILYSKENQVRNSLEKSKFQILEVNRMGDWISFVTKI
ncbi:MAG: 50S ribosomal protein L11 methyltransferase [Anaerolineaceae bacterium]|nr:MAG: 50S ribosomal protein L11 methyltransferase [Anaerolineaceae bacterium]